MPVRLKKVTVTICSDLSLHILDYFKNTKRWPVDKVIDEALRVLFDEK